MQTIKCMQADKHSYIIAIVFAKSETNLFKIEFFIIKGPFFLWNCLQEDFYSCSQLYRPLCTCKFLRILGRSFFPNHYEGNPPFPSIPSLIALLPPPPSSEPGAQLPRLVQQTLISHKIRTALCTWAR